VLEVLDDRGEVLRCYSKYLDTEIEIERGLVKPFLMGKDVHRYEVANPGHVVVFPYALDNGKVELFSQSQLEQFQLGWSYLTRCKKYLKEREKGRFADHWWAYGRPQNINEFAANRKNGLELPDTTLLRRATSRIALDRRDDGLNFSEQGGMVFGGYELDFDTWFDVVLEIGKVDASHGWCASLMIHHAHLIGQFPEEAQQAVWAEGPDVAIAASFAPTTQVIRVEGGYRVSGQHSTFASGVDHSSWVVLGGFARDEGAPEWRFFLIPRSDYKVRDTWFMAGMRATGSNTIVTDNVFVPNIRVLKLSDLRDGKGPGGALNESPIFHTLFFHYAPLTFAAPMLGAARGAYEYFREWTKARRAADGTSIAEKTSIQVRMARAAADLDAAELLLRRTTQVPHAPDAHSPQLLARSVRDFLILQLSCRDFFDSIDPQETLWLSSPSANRLRSRRHLVTYPCQFDILQSGTGWWDWIAILETARVHHAARRRVGGVAACGAPGRERRDRDLLRQQRLHQFGRRAGLHIDGDHGRVLDQGGCHLIVLQHERRGGLDGAGLEHSVLDPHGRRERLDLRVLQRHLDGGADRGGCLGRHPHGLSDRNRHPDRERA
jgi:hypothetical protein